MRKISLLLILYGIVAFRINAQIQYGVGATYYGEEFLKSPGIEGVLTYKNHSLHISVSLFYENPDFNQISNTSVIDGNGLNYIGIGYGYDVIGKSNWKLRAVAQLTRQLGPRYFEIDYYEAGGYYIYRREESKKFRVPVGFHLGFKQFFGLYYYDFIDQQYRIGLGYVFGRVASN